MVKSDLVFEVREFLDKRPKDLRAWRVLLYRDDFDGKEVSPELTRATEHTETPYQDARALRSIRQQNGIVEIEVEWDGLPDKVDTEGEPLSAIREARLETLRYTLQAAGYRDLKQKVCG